MQQRLTELWYREPARPSLLQPLGSLYGALVALRRRAYGSGWPHTESAGRPLVVVGNLTVGGTGKTTLTLHLARRAAELGIAAAVVCRRYHPGPRGEADEERMYRDAIGPERVYAGRVKRDLAAAAAGAGAQLILVDDGFSHWALERDLDVVLLEAADPWGGGRLLPAGRLREPRRALQRAGIVIVTRIPADAADAPDLAEIRRVAPAALIATARHEVRGFRSIGGAPCARPARVRIVSATGHPDAVERSAREAGCEVAGRGDYRDHHWFTPAEARREHGLARGGTLLLSAKDAVRWPEGAPRDGVAVLETRWEWVRHGEDAERLVWDRDESKAPGEAHT